ncbi:unnamed protein product [Arabidopsis halleri]
MLLISLSRNWCKAIFFGSLRGKAETNTCQERLKLEGWLKYVFLFREFISYL